MGRQLVPVDSRYPSAQRSYKADDAVEYHDDQDSYEQCSEVLIDEHDVDREREDNEHHCDEHVSGPSRAAGRLGTDARGGRSGARLRIGPHRTGWKGSIGSSEGGRDRPRTAVRAEGETLCQRLPAGRTVAGRHAGIESREVLNEGTDHRRLWSPLPASVAYRPRSRARDEHGPAEISPCGRLISWNRDYLRPGDHVRRSRSLPEVSGPGSPRLAVLRALRIATWRYEPSRPRLPGVRELRCCG